MENMNDFLAVTAFVMVGSLYVISTSVMFLMKMFVIRNKVAINIQEQAFNQTSSLFRLLIVPLSFNSSSVGIQTWMKRDYVFGMIIALFMGSMLLTALVGLLTSTDGNRVINAASATVLVWFIVYSTLLYHRNLSIFKRKCFELQHNKE